MPDHECDQCRAWKRRGQIWSLDFAMGIVIMLILLTVIGPYYNSMKSGLREEQNTILRQAIQASEILMSPGVPYDWNASNVYVVGLADRDNPVMLVPEKISSFLNMTQADYAGMKRMLRCDAVYEFHVEGVYDNGTLAQVGSQNFSAGVAPSSTAGNIIGITRYARINSNIIQLKLLLWEAVGNS